MNHMSDDRDSMRISVILSTYNRPKALLVVLEALGRQDDHNFEVIVADDGSGTETRDVVNAMATKWPQCNIQHVWHEKKGFRLARIRNLACKVCTGEYLVFLDGDCIPPPNFVSRHRALSEKGRAVYGQRILANQQYTELVETNPKQLFRNNYWSCLNFFSLAIKKHINRVFPIVSLPGTFWRNRSPRSWQKIRGCNWAIWRNDYEAINGSDESFEGWGAEDKDLAVRLINQGIRLKDGRNYSVVLHLWHPQASREKNEIQSRIVIERLSNKTILPKKGLKP
jgi:glycosyltransferase involved in cell wall biosynthesis